VISAAVVKLEAIEAGFDLCGIAAAAPHPKLARLASWIDEGRAGDMHYLRESLDERLDVTKVLPTARSVISLGCVYNTRAPLSIDTPPGHAFISRYAWGDDYHDVLKRRVRRLLERLAAAIPGLEAVSCVDAGPVQERVFAEQAGLGWIGKNTCLINQKLGSWIFLAAIVTNAELEPDPPATDHCGTCTRCIDACPTGAIVEPWTVDATRCLSYLTIETRRMVDEPLRPFVHTQVFGCDICQDVCPWNRKAAVSDDPAWQPRPGLQMPTIVELACRTDAEWRAFIRNSAMRRAGVRRIRRSLALAAARLPVEEAERALAAIEREPSSAFPDVREAVDWARQQVRETTAEVGER